MSMRVRREGKWRTRTGRACLPGQKVWPTSQRGSGVKLEHMLWEEVSEGRMFPPAPPGDEEEEREGEERDEEEEKEKVEGKRNAR
eukprot:425123-Hanusia_phi.AAC.1